MKLFSKLQNLPERESEAFFKPIVDSVMNFQHEFVIEPIVIDSDAFDPAISKSSIDQMILIIESSDSLEEIVIMFPDRNELIISQEDTELFVGFGDFLKSKELFIALL